MTIAVRTRPRWTNIHNVHEVFVRAVTYDDWYDKPDCDITVTQLIKPPQAAYLEQVHQHELQEDVADRVWSIGGQLMHELLRHVQLDGALQEERLYVEVLGWRVGGRMDLYWKEELWDFKETSVWSFMFGRKADWEAQLNLYALMVREHGFPVGRVAIAARLRDWQKRKAREAEAKRARGEDDGYPSAGFLNADYPLWDERDARRDLERRVRLHQEARRGAYPPCSDEDRWADAERYAVRVRRPNGAIQRRAVRVLDDRAEAEAMAERLTQKGSKGFVELRQGDQTVRCRDYCIVRDFCPQFAESSRHLDNREVC